MNWYFFYGISFIISKKGFEADILGLGHEFEYKFNLIYKEGDPDEYNGRYSISFQFESNDQLVNWS